MTVPDQRQARHYASPVTARQDLPLEHPCLRPYRWDVTWHLGHLDADRRELQSIALGVCWVKALQVAWLLDHCHPPDLRPSVPRLAFLSCLHIRCQHAQGPHLPKDDVRV